MTPNEKRLAALYATCQKLKSAIEAGTIKADDAALKSEFAKLAEQTERVALERALVGSGGTAGAGLADIFSRVKASGFDYENKPRVSLGSLGSKAFLADGTDAQIVPLAISGWGQDDRFAYQAFPSVALGDATSVQGLVQTARTLATPSNMDVSLTGSDQKPESVISIALATTDAKMIAHVSEPIANAIWKLPAVSEFIRSEMAYGLGLGIDSFLLTSLTAASGTNVFTQVTETLYDAYRAAIKVARADGCRPNVALLHPDDAYDLEIAKDANDRYYGPGVGQTGFGSLWGLTVVESNAVVAGSPVLVDVARFGKVFLGDTQFAVNSSSTPTIDLFGTNRSIARLETPMAVHVADANAIVEITLT